MACLLAFFAGMPRLPYSGIHPREASLEAWAPPLPALPAHGDLPTKAQVPYPAMPAQRSHHASAHPPGRLPQPQRQDAARKRQPRHQCRRPRLPRRPQRRRQVLPAQDAGRPDRAGQGKSRLRGGLPLRLHAPGRAARLDGPRLLRGGRRHGRGRQDARAGPRREPGTGGRSVEGGRSPGQGLHGVRRRLGALRRGARRREQPGDRSGLRLQVPLRRIPPPRRPSQGLADLQGLASGRAHQPP